MFQYLQTLFIFSFAFSGTLDLGKNKFSFIEDHLELNSLTFGTNNATSAEKAMICKNERKVKIFSHG